MHDGCSGQFEDGKQVVDKVRAMGFAKQPVMVAFDVKCENCDKDFKMTHFETKCPHCSMVYGVTPCHAFDASSVKAAGIDY